MNTAVYTHFAQPYSRKTTPVGSLTAADKWATAAIFLYWLAYENIIFFYAAEIGGPALVLISNIVKVLLPLCLLAYTQLPSEDTFTRGPTAFYILFFAAFLGWALVPTIISGNPVTWMKLLPRFAFFLSVVRLFSKRPQVFTMFAKCLILYVLSALAQYVMIYLTGSFGHPEQATIAVFAGPFGLFGNVTSTMFLPGAPFPFVRVAGFWNEPSNASGSAFAAFFLAQYLVASGENPVWRKAGTGCLIAGILTLSNAGYFAFGSALLLGLLFGGGAWTAGRIAKVAVLLPLAGALLLTVTVGRSYVAANLSDNVWARAVTGARLSEDPNYYDPTNGRLDLVKQTASTATSSVIGVGIQEVGSGGIESSATAPLYWLLLTGIPGMMLILCREGVLLFYARTLVRRGPEFRGLAQALVVVMAQHLVYGSWMNPNYFVLAAMVIVSARAVLGRQREAVTA